MPIEYIDRATGEKVVESVELPAKTATLWLRLQGDFRVGRDIAHFAYSLDGHDWHPMGSDYKMVFDYRRFFMGSKFALFCYATRKSGGYADFDCFQYSRIASEPLEP